MNSNTYRSSVNLPEVVKVIDNENYTTILRNKGLCELTYKSKGIITLDVAKELTKEILDFYPKGYVIVADSDDVMLNISSEAREYFAKAPEILEKRKAQAIISRNLGQRLMAKFYINFYSHSCPTKAFSNKNDAFIWISQYLLD
ncbi:MAG TPA: hypothetical protein DIU39_04925 [Flavobacteriales bacterium]|nr:hypothetical protein [Flavobacteriales bacterium]|tara:strand:+ start:65059 stop:65490 length:432 start_codon:yes stop_codon:yes gene_type:complete